MADAEPGVPRADPVVAKLTYTVDTGVKPVTGTTDPDGRLRLSIGKFQEHEVEIQDGRPFRSELSLDRQGFQLVDHPTAVTDFHDSDELETVYYPEIEGLVKKLTGASRVIIFDHTIRTGDEAAQEAKRLREPVKVVHNDYTDWSAPQRLRELLPADEADALLRHCRLAVIQIWRPIRGPVRSSPLAICDSRTVAPADLIATERRHPNRIGEIYQLAHNPRHRWFYFPEMARNEAIVFKCYDSETDGRARFAAHGSFDDPATLLDAPARESIEVRTLALWEPHNGCRARGW